MAATDTHILTSPRIYLIRMSLFLILAGFLAFILYRQIWVAFMANPALNALIFGVLAIGAAIAVLQVARLSREVRWVNGLRRPDDAPPPAPPILLAPMASLVGSRANRMAIPMGTLRALLDSIAGRLDENREVVRYLAGLAIILGLLGTFWGLIETVSALGRTILSLRSGNDSTALFEDLKGALAQPLAGMGIAFSSSLFGVAVSAILGFLDLQAGQAQNSFYTQLENFLSSNAVDAAPEPSLRMGGAASPDLTLALSKLTSAVNDGASSRQATQAMANLAEGIQGLVQHMRAEQQMIRDWVEAQAARERDLKAVLDRLTRERV